MESRLPKPKIVINKIISTIDMNTKSCNPKVTRPVKNNNGASTSSADTKSTNENKAPNKQTLVRAKTLSTITASNNTKAIKRTATVISHGEIKKALVKPTVAKPLVTRANNPVTNNNNINKTNKVVNNTNNATDNKTGKVKKWDLQGRLAQANDKLCIAQQKSKSIESKYSALQELVDTLKTSETECRIKAEKLENSNNTLTNELQTLTTEISILKKNEEDLTERLKDSEESCTSLSRTLNEVQEKYMAQEVLNIEQTKQLTILKTDLDFEKKRNEDLTIIKERSEALMYQMDKERRVLHNTIQELKGNIRVFCRVRPRTLKETEQIKT